jgi:multidrug efflux system membrane fusion protein
MTAERDHGRGRWWLLAVAAVVAGSAGVWAALSHPDAAEKPPAPAVQPGVPVVVTRAAQHDVPINARGLGTVQAWRFVTIRAEVTGYLQDIKFREGQEVQPGQVIAVIDPRPYAAVLGEAQAKLAGDQAQLVNDETNYRRDATLARKGFASVQQEENDLALVRQYAANVQADTAAIAAAKLNLDFCTITAPIQGVIGFRMVDIGNLIQANGTQGIATIQQVHPIAVVFTLAEQDFPQVQAAMAAGKLPALAYSADGRTKLTDGTLVTPNNTIATSTGTIALKAIFPNAENKLWPGQFVEVELRLRVAHNVLTVPVQALEHGPDGLYVYEVGADSTVTHQNVSVGYQDAKLAQITAGLSAGDEVVVSGQSRLQDGTKIRAAPAPTATTVAPAQNPA